MQAVDFWSRDGVLSGQRPLIGRVLSSRRGPRGTVTMMPRLLFGLSLLVLLWACSSEIYLRDGVTDGDTFYLAERALSDDDPVLQSWVSYSLTLSACKLRLGGDNPARASSFDCELMARRHLLDTWQEQRSGDPAVHNEYLDTLARVRAAGWLDEYVARYRRRPGWTVPATVDLDGFRTWQRRELPGHEAVTRIIGSWNYARNVQPTP